MFRFEKLDVWNKATQYYGLILDASNKFPKDEVFGITSQIRRSSLSVSLNNAEGSGRTSKREFAQFLGYAQGSLFETVSNLVVCKGRGLISEAEYCELYQKGEELGKMISGFRSSL